MSTTEAVLRHRGPFFLMVIRPNPKKPNRFVSEWLKEQSSKDDVESDVMGLMTDPLDTIVSVAVWSDAENQFVGNYNKEKDGEQETA